MSDNTPAASAADDDFDLDPVEIRVLATMIEKSYVTPDNYPMSVNAVMTGCNQLTGREPVMSLDESDVRDAIARLIERKLVAQRDSASARVPKYEHLIRLRHSLPPAEQAVLATLMLRGPQTAGEIRQRCERMHAFADIPAVEAVLDHLSEKYPPMVEALPRAPGTKETRFAHLLEGRAAFESLAEAVAQGAPASGGSGGRGRVAELEDEVRRLREELEALRGEFAEFRSQFD